MNNLSSVLNKNVRNWVYLKINKSKGIKIANSKLKTKKILFDNGINVPKLLGSFKNQEDVVNFAWEKFDGNFVVKPTCSSGGEGILVVRKRAKWAGEWFLMDGSKIDIASLRLHCFEVLQGRYNVNKTPDRVFIEERIKIHPKFLRYTKSGTPDIRVIIFNKIPVMAMLRIPTEESGSTANLHQGGIGLGIDLATGITTYGVLNDRLVKTIYDRKRKKKIKVNGLRVPFWNEILRSAVMCQQAIPELGYLGVDVVLDKEKGPMLLELNARPGLSIQICNRAGLKKRLERVAGLKVRNVDHAIKICQSLFGSGFVDRVSERRAKIISSFESVKVKTGLKDPKQIELDSKIDTGAFRSSIDKATAKKIGLLSKENVLYYRHYRSSMGRGHRRPVIEITFWLNGHKIVTAANVSDRHGLRKKLLIGRRDLKDFMIRVKE